MGEENITNGNGVQLTPKQALANLLKSIQNPLIFFALGFGVCYWMERRPRRKQIGG